MLIGDLTQPEDIAAETFSLLMETRGMIEERLSQLRSGVEKEEETLGMLSREMMEILVRLTDQQEGSAKLREVSQRLLQLRETVSMEVMRILTLPEEADCQKEEYDQTRTGGRMDHNYFNIFLECLIISKTPD